MSVNKTPRFIIKKNANKVPGLFEKLLTAEVLEDICYKITGQRKYKCYFKDNEYTDKYYSDRKWNTGRMAVLLYEDKVAYITISDEEPKSKGRNSAVQSATVTFNKFFLDKSKKKELFYYFICKKEDAETPYLSFVYRLLKTVGFVFLNDKEVLGRTVKEFTSSEDIITLKRAISNSARNTTNNPTFIARDENNTIQLFGKTFGAQKYESSMICYALAKVEEKGTIELYEIADNGLFELPAPSRKVIKKIDKIEYKPTNILLEKQAFKKKQSLRSPLYIYNLLNTIGPKKCALCGCKIESLIQGAHIWPIAKIRKEHAMTFDEKYVYATSGNNGIWLCENHHKLFDANELIVSKKGEMVINEKMNDENKEFVKKITEEFSLESTYISTDFVFFVEKRYEEASN